MTISPSDARLLIAASEHDANQFYATKMLVPDPFIGLEMNGKTVIVLSDLELERGRREAHVDEVLPLSKYRDRLKKQGNEYPKLIDIAECVLRDYQIQSVTVPGNFAVQYADPLRERGFRIHFEEPFSTSRACKTPQEITWVQETQQHNETALNKAIQLIGEAEIGPDHLLYSHGKVLTSQEIRRQIQHTLLECGCMDYHSIVACGEQATRPHERGSGPLQAHQAIIIDIFPYSLTTRYFADMTRTVVKGKASDELKHMYATVRTAQEMAIHSLRAGINGLDIHRGVQEFFTQSGFETTSEGGIPQGFIHGTGHGLGLEIHEPPRIGHIEAILEPGNVVTVEPGLYYPHIGGVRLEDLVVVTENGSQNLTTFPKILEIP